MHMYCLISFDTLILSWLHLVRWHAVVNRNLCALMSLMWSKTDTSFQSNCLKACSKGVITYETTGTGSRLTGENVEKMGVFMMKKMTLCLVCTNQKNRLARVTHNRGVS